MVDAGVPDGAHGSLVLSARHWLRLHAGAGYNGASVGLRGGVSILPFDLVVQPALIVEAGRYFEGDANPLMRTLLGDDSYHNDALSRIGYDYVNAHVGIEVGSRAVRFFIHGGYSYVATSLRDADALFGDGSLHFARAPRATGLIPSARLGVIVYLH